MANHQQCNNKEQLLSQHHKTLQQIQLHEEVITFGGDNYNYLTIGTASLVKWMTSFTNQCLLRLSARDPLQHRSLQHDFHELSLWSNCSPLDVISPSTFSSPSGVFTEPFPLVIKASSSLQLNSFISLHSSSIIIRSFSMIYCNLVVDNETLISSGAIPVHAPRAPPTTHRRAQGLLRKCGISIKTDLGTTRKKGTPRVSR